MSTSPKDIHTLTPKEYQLLLSSGTLWKEYPEATGNYTMDCMYTLQKMYATLNETARENQAEFYNTHFQQTVQNEGFNYAVAQIIISKAYDDGHSAGYSEIVLHAIQLCDFIKQVIEVSKPASLPPALKTTLPESKVLASIEPF